MVFEPVSFDWLGEIVGNVAKIKEVSIDDVVSAVEGQEPLETFDLGSVLICRYGGFLHLSADSGRQVVIAL